MTNIVTLRNTGGFTRMDIGYLYMLGNDCMPGIYKIGMTRRDPDARALELSKATGVPTPFNVLHAKKVFSPALAERHVHQELACCRVNDSREFFRARRTQFLLAAMAFEVPEVEFEV